MKALILVAVSCLILHTSAADESHVKGKFGEITGKKFISESGETFIGFLKVPYAQPPIGELRFKKPEPLLGIRRTWNSTEDGPPCPQVDPKTMQYSGSEDCLYLNVYTPKIDCSGPCNFHVIVYFPAGGFATSDGPSRTIGLRRFPLTDIVFVSVTYRVGPFGFLSTDDFNAPGNYGLFDQLEALRWVFRYINLFGGDSSQITLLGVGAGAASVIYHILSPLSIGLFQRAIAMSGSALCPWAFRNDPLYWTEKLAEDLNCPTVSKYALVECLRNVPAKDLAEKGSYETNGMLLPAFIPTVDNNFVLGPPLHTLSNMIFERRRLTILIGTTKDEKYCSVLGMNKTFSSDDINDILQLAVSFHPNATEVIKTVSEHYSLTNVTSEDNRERLAKALTDGMFHNCIYNTAKHLADYRNLVFLYRYDYEAPFSVSQENGKTQTYGVCHYDDMFMLFDGPIFGNVTFDTMSTKVRDNLHHIFLSFIKTGTPVCTSPSPYRWRGIMSRGFIVLTRITESCSMERKPNGTSPELWLKLIADNNSFIRRKSIVYCT